MPGVQPVSSVEAELIYAFNGHIKCTDIKFQSAGREDMDVRMIGSGRPFSLTFLNPVPDENKPAPLSKQQFLQSFQEEIPTSIICNYGVSAYDLQATMQIPDMQPKHVKEYQCVVCCSRNITDEMLNEIDSIENLTIQQKTPSRVAHRREMMYREKTILKMVTQRICANFFLLRLRTSSGTYIKEFVNSDFGRTRPSLGMILDPSNPVECQLMQLDVIYVGE
ncbi:putative tRNA pseudouridine synthase Pus10 [Histomonas meleagridis]|uniref:putative tRNA pseudouridine synthase Pus10 n=1 Tax=Histomonas meleagridis TaxID=135588 RepID=UPI003559B341|nr:putative tRNA pseudouridine synthase Pus10 [Histomonas meleagridis]KAH0804884.1 putative tRNA pseudouridine synthase Pus10 [Histomonas meleagridis]